MATAGHPRNRELRHARAPKTPAEKLRGFYVHLIVYLCVNVGLLILNFRRNPEHLWFYWVAMGWGIGLVFHAAKVFMLSSYETDNTNTPPDNPSL
jgi:hypothetical protein